MCYNNATGSTSLLQLLTPPGWWLPGSGIAPQSNKDFAVQRASLFNIQGGATPSKAAANAQTPDLPLASVTPLTPLLGRETDLLHAKNLLLRDGVRLLTMWGPGGVGKTRLALQLCDELESSFSDDVYFVSLAAVNDPALFPETVAHAFGLKESSDEQPFQLLKDHLSSKRALLLLDNFEQITGASPQLAELLWAAPDLHVIVTSREVLHIRGEHEFIVQPLGLPPRESSAEGAGQEAGASEAASALMSYAAVQLFVQRARDVKSDFSLTGENAPIVAEICARLDGLPLAIELAAARIKLLSPRGLLARLEHRLQLLTGGARDLPTRQQTLRNTLDWSFDLLDDEERKLFTLLPVFVGGFTIDAAESIAQAEGISSPLDAISSLVDKSLLRQRASANEEYRFSMLETVREYAWDLLEQSGDAVQVGAAHAAHYLEMVKEADTGLGGPEQVEWMARLDTEHDNIRAALRWSMHNDEAKTALGMVRVLWRFWELRGYLREGRRWMEQVIERGKENGSETLAGAMHGAGRLVWLQGDYRQTEEYEKRSLALYRELGSKRGAASALHGLAIVTSYQGRHEEAQSYYEESLALWRELGNWSNAARLLNSMAIEVRTAGNYIQAEAYLREALELAKQAGNKRSISTYMCELGLTELLQDNYDTALSLLKESIVLRVEGGLKIGLINSLAGIGGVAARTGDAGRAARLFGAVTAISRELNYSVEPEDAWIMEDGIARARSAISEADFETAWDAGSLLSLDAAVAEALDETAATTAVPAATSQTPTTQTPAASNPAISAIDLSQSDFYEAVRAALRNYPRAVALYDSPLLQTHLVAARIKQKEVAGTAAYASALQAVLLEAAESLQKAPRDAKLYRALHHTYFQPAATQELAAELLDLPFSTYRRHLQQGIARVAEILWHWEIESRRV